MPDDIPELCCAAGICCDMTKRVKTLAKLLRHQIPALHEPEALAVAGVIHDTFTLVPKGLIDDFIHFIQEHPYE